MLLIIADVIFFSVVFVYMDDIETNMVKSPAKAQRWLACLITTKGDKNKCLNFAQELVINEATVMAVLILLSVRIPSALVARLFWTKTNHDLVLDERYLVSCSARPMVYVHRVGRSRQRPDE